MNARQCVWSAALLAVGLLGCAGESPSGDNAATAADPVKKKLLAGSAVAKATATEWSRFRGPDGAGTAAGAKLPLTWNLNEHITWKTPLPGAGASSPIVSGDHIYLTAYTGYGVPGEAGDLSQLQRHLLALSRTDGKILWDKSIAAPLPEEQRIRDHGYAASTPAADAAGVVVFFGKSGVVAFDHQGQQQWQSNVGQKTNGWGSSASPVFSQDLVIINASVESDSLVALNRKTGDEVWRAGGIKEAWNTPILVTANGRTEVVVATQGKILAFDSATGKPLWSCNTDITWYMAPSMVSHEGVIYAIGGRSGITALAVRAGGSGDVTSSHRLWTIKEGSNVSSPVFVNGHLYFVSDSQGIAYCVEGATGKVVYEKRFERAGQFYASALLGSGRIYYLTRDGKTFVVDAQPEFKQLAKNDLSDRGVFDASPAVNGNQLLIRSDKFLYCVEE